MGQKVDDDEITESLLLLEVGEVVDVESGD